jgi:hypothetical protein
MAGSNWEGKRWRNDGLGNGKNFELGHGYFPVLNKTTLLICERIPNHFHPEFPGNEIVAAFNSSGEIAFEIAGSTVAIKIEGIHEVHARAFLFAYNRKNNTSYAEISCYIYKKQTEFVWPRDEEDAYYENYIGIYPSLPDFCEWLKKFRRYSKEFVEQIIKDAEQWK